MKYTWLILFTQVFCIDCFAQTPTIASLKKILPSLYDSARIDCLNNLSEAYIYLKPDTAKMYAVKAYNEALRINYFRGMAKSFSNRGYIEAKATGRYQLAESYGKKAIELYEKTDDKKGLAHAYVIWSFALMSQGFYDSSINGDIKVIQLCREVNYKVDEARATTMIGINYLAGGNYTKAFEYCMNGLRVARQSKDSERITISLTYVGQLYTLAGDLKTALAYYFESLSYAKGNILLQHPQIDIGNIYYLQKKYDSALFYYNQYIDTVKSITTDSSVRYGYIMGALTQIGEIFLAKNQYDTALAYFKEPLNLSRKVNDQNNLMGILFDIARSYYGKKNYKAALRNAQGCLQLAEKFRAKKYLQDDNQLMYSIFDRFKRTDSAYFHYRQYMDMKDSVALEAFNRKMDLYKAASEDEKKQAQIKLLSSEKLINQQQLKLQQQQIKSEALWRKTLIAGILTLLLLGVIAFRHTKIKRRNEKLQLENKLRFQKLESEKTKAELQQQTVNLEMQALRAQMNPHFIFNCLSSINRFILVNRSEEASDYLTKFSRLIRMVLHNSEKSFITLENEIEALRLYLDLEQLRFKNSFNYNITFCNTIELSAVFIPPMLIQPFVENAIWHGLQGKNNGNGEISIGMDIQDNILQCSICDNGIGRSASVIKKDTDITKRSLGINLTQRRLQLIDPLKQNQTSIEFQDIKIDSEQTSGTRVYIKIPVSYTS